MKFKTLFASILALIILVSCQNVQTKKINQLLDKECDSLLSNDEINAVSLGVYHEGETYMLHKGELTKLKKDKPNNETVYEIASLTKTFAGTLLANAIVENKVNLDDDIRTVLKNEFPNLEFNKSPITFRHLVTHRSGIPIMLPYNPEIFDNPNYETLPHLINDLQKGITKQVFFEELYKVELDTLPGEKFGYSNAGANLLGYCLEAIYNKPFEELLNETILSPLEMRSTKIALSLEEKGNMAQGYNEKGTEMPFSVEKEMSADGGIKSTLSDMMKYVAYHLDEDNSIIKTSHKELLGIWDDFDNGFFWQIRKEKETPRKIFQNGGAFGTSSWLTLIPETQTGVFIITNASGPNTHRRLSTTVNNILDELRK